MPTEHERGTPGLGDAIADVFPFGLAPLIILVGTVVSGAYLLAHTVLAPGEEAEADLTMWTFASEHYQAYENARPGFEAKHPGVRLDLQLVHQDAVTRRLRAAFWSGLNIPDAVEVEITRAGSFFRGPVEDVPFIDLTDRLQAPDPADPEGGPLMDRIVQARFSSYTNRGRIFGLPHDVHPVMLAYRADLFAELGLRAEDLDTWTKFIAAGRRVTDQRSRYMINLTKGGAASFEVLLFQRDGEGGRPAGYFDADGNVIMDNENAVTTMLWFVPLVAGPERIAADPGMFGQNFVQAVADGYTLTFICPDWKSGTFETNAPHLTGRMRLMPLPAVRPGGRRTSTWGGTMFGITADCKDKDLAWALARHLYLNPDDLGDRFRDLNILPPYKHAWEHPAFHEPRPFWSGQAIGDAYIALADDVPPQWGSPFLELAKSKMGEAVSGCVAYYRDHGEAGFAAAVRERLTEAADKVRRQMGRNPF
jgi:arabinosaccharide transport system substrate-binding protein